MVGSEVFSSEVKKTEILMENFRRVSLDFADRKVRFQLRKCHHAAITMRTSTRASRIRTSDERACS